MHTVLAIVTQNSKVLVGNVKEEKSEQYGGIRHAFPSMQTETQDEVENLLIQEIKSQTNLDVAINKMIGQRVHPSTNNLTEYQHCIVVTDSELRPSKPADLERFQWVDFEDLRTLMPTLYIKVYEYLARL